MGIFDNMNLWEAASQFLGGAIILLLVIFGGALNAVVIWLAMKYKKYKTYTVYIFSKDSLGNLEMTQDSAGIFKDFSGKNRFWLRKAKVGLNAEVVPWIRLAKKKVVYLLKCSEKSYKFINMHIPDEKLAVTVGVEDVNWAKDEYVATKKAFIVDFLEKYAGLIAVVMCAGIIMIMVIYTLKKFDTLIELGRILQQASSNLKCGGNLI